MNLDHNFDLSFHVEQQEFKNIKHFIYKEKRYPIDFDKLKKNSKYFYQNRKLFKQITDIIILDEFDDKFISIQEKTIQAFIASCQNEPCKIHYSDVIPLQYLSYKYEFPKLISITENFIQEHSDKLVFHSILFKSSLRPNNSTFSIPINFFNTKNEEEIISDHLNEYIQNDQMLLLPIPVIHRILTNSKSKSDKNFNKICNELVEFLFKLLDKYGKEASILFSLIDFENQPIFVMNKLIQNYSNIFDFNYINSNLLKTTIQLTNEVAKIKEEYSNFIFEMKQKQEKLFLEMNENEEKRKKIFEEEMEKIRVEEKKREEYFSLMKEEQNERAKKLEDEIEKIKQEYQKRNKMFEVEMRKIQEKEEERLKQIEIEKERLKQIEIENKNVKEFIHKDGNEFNGIMRFLTEKTGSNIHDNKTIEITANADSQHPKNLVDYDKDNYYNSGTPNYEPKICFDFKDRRIQLHGYSIKSHKNGKGDGNTIKNYPGHLKNWLIEVSNDGKTWETIDQHKNDSTLNGSSIVANFNVKKITDNFYRFIQLRTTGYSWYGDNRYDIFFYYIEFFGKLKEPKSE